MTTITIRENRVDAVTAEGAKASMEVEDLVRALKQSPFDMADYMPRTGDGNFTAQRELAILIHSIQPRVWNLKWIRDDSPSRYGPGTGYRNVSARTWMPCCGACSKRGSITVAKRTN